MKFKEKSVLILIILIGVVFLFSSSVSAADTKVLVTKTSTGGYANSQSTNPSTSANGDYVAFESYATNLGTGSSGKGVQDIYVYSYKTKKTEWITHTPTGKAANGNSYTPSISGDGRYVTFASTATNLGPGGSGKGIKDIYLYDRKLKVMKWITHSPTGKPASNHSSNPVISADSNYVAFQSTAKNLGPGGSEYYVSDIYLYNRVTNNIKWVTQTTEGKTANGASMNPSISENGRYIAFETVATNLGSDPYILYGNGKDDIFVYDRDLGTFNWITKNPPKITADTPGGPYNFPLEVTLILDKPGTIYYTIKYISGSIDTGTFTDIMNNVYVTLLINEPAYIEFYGISTSGIRSDLVSELYLYADNTLKIWATPSHGEYYHSVIVSLDMSPGGSIFYSTDGSYPNIPYNSPITINKSTTLWFLGITEEGFKVFRTEKYKIIPYPKGGFNPSISANGSLIALESGNQGGTNNNIFVYDPSLITKFRLVTQTIKDEAANGTSNNPSISGNGQFVAFETFANNLGPDPNQPYGSNIPGINYYGNLRKDIFVYDIVNDVMKWITKNPNNGPANGNSYTPSLNGDGSRLAFSSSATNLGPGGNGVYRDIFLSGNGLHDTLPVNVITISQLNTAAKNIRNYYDSHSKTLPTSVTINAQTYTMSQMLYLLTTATINMSNSNLYPIAAKTVNSATSPSGTISSGNIVKSRYISYAKSIRNYINSYGRAPNYVATTLGNMKLKYMVYMYSKIVNYYKSNNRLPNYVSITK